MYGNALQAAAHHGTEECVRVLLNAAAAVNACDGYHGTELQVAARYGRYEAADPWLRNS